MTFNIYLKSKNFKFNPNIHKKNILIAKASVESLKTEAEMFDEMVEHYKRIAKIHTIPLGNFNKKNQFLLKFKHVSLSKKNIFVSDKYPEKLKDFSICFETLKKEVSSYGGTLIDIKKNIWVASCIKEFELKQALITMEMIHSDILQSKNFNYYLSFENNSKEMNLNKKSKILFVSDNTILVEFFKSFNTNSTSLNNFDLDNFVPNYKKVILYFNDHSNDQKKNLDIIQRIVKSKISYKIYVFTQDGIKIIRFNKMLNFFSKLKYLYF